MAQNNGINPLTGLPYGSAKDAFNLINKVPVPRELTGSTDSVFRYEGTDDFESYLRYGITPIPGIDLNEARAQAQPFTEKLGRGLTKLAGKTGTALSGATIGTLYGIGAAIGNREWNAFYDNEFQRTMDDWNEKMDKNMAHYYTKKEQQAGFLESLGSANFWLNDVSGAMSFTLGAVLSELVLSAATSLTGGATAGVQAIQTANLLSKMKTLAKGVNKAKNIERASTAAKVARQLITGAGYEAGVEARHFKDQAMDSFMAANPNATQDDLVKAQNFINMQANAVYGLNLALVGYSNAAQFKTIFGKGLKTQASAGFRQGITKESGDFLTGTFAAASKKASKLEKGLDVGYRIVKNPIYEGVIEEGGQSVISNTALNYLQKGYSVEGTGASYDIASAFMDSMAETYGTKEGWKEIGIGMIVGAMGAPSFRAIPFIQKGGWAGGISDSVKEYKGAIAEQEDLADKNTKWTFDNIRNHVKANNQIYKSNQEIGDNLERNNIFGAKNGEADGTFGFLSARHEAGMLGDTIDEFTSKVSGLDMDEFKAEFGYEAESKEDLATRKGQVIESFKEKAKAVESAMSDGSVFAPSEDFSDEGAQNWKTAISHLIYRIHDGEKREDGLFTELAERVPGLDITKFKSYLDLKASERGLKGSVTKAEKELTQHLPEFQAILADAAAMLGKPSAAMAKIQKELDALTKMQKLVDLGDQPRIDKLNERLEALKVKQQAEYDNIIARAEKDKTVKADKVTAVKQKLADHRTKLATVAKQEKEELKRLTKTLQKDYENYETVAAALADYEAEADKIKNATTPVNRRTLTQITTDIAALRKQREYLIDNYNWLFTKEGQEKIEDATGKMIKLYDIARSNLEREGAILRGKTPKAVTKEQAKADNKKTVDNLNKVTEDEFKRDWDQYNAEIANTSLTIDEQLVTLESWKTNFQTKAKKYGSGEKHTNYANAAEDAMFRIANLKSTKAQQKARNTNLAASVFSPVVHQFWHLNQVITLSASPQLRGFISNLSTADLIKNGMVSVDEYEGDGYGKTRDHNAKVSTVNGHTILQGKAVHLWYQSDTPIGGTEAKIVNGKNWYKIGYMPDPRRFVDKSGSTLLIDNSPVGIANISALNDAFVDNGKLTDSGAKFLGRHQAMVDLFNEKLNSVDSSIPLKDNAFVSVRHSFKYVDVVEKPTIDDFFQTDDYNVTIPGIGTGLFLVERDDSDPANHVVHNNNYIREKGVWRKLTDAETVKLKQWVPTGLKDSDGKNKFQIAQGGQFSLIASHSYYNNSTKKQTREPMVYDTGKPTIKSITDKEATWKAIQEQLDAVDAMEGTVTKGIPLKDAEGRNLFVNLKAAKFIDPESHLSVRTRLSIFKWDDKGTKIEMQFVHQGIPYFVRVYSKQSGKITSLDELMDNIARNIKSNDRLAGLRQIFPDLEFSSLSSVYDEIPTEVGKLLMNTVPHTEIELNKLGFGDYISKLEGVVPNKKPANVTPEKKDTGKKSSKGSLGFDIETNPNTESSKAAVKLFQETFLPFFLGLNDYQDLVDTLGHYNKEVSVIEELAKKGEKTSQDMWSQLENKINTMKPSGKAEKLEEVKENRSKYVIIKREEISDKELENIFIAENYFRSIGEEGLNDALKSGVLRPARIEIGTAKYKTTFYTTGEKGLGRVLEYLEKTDKPVMVVLKESAFTQKFEPSSHIMDVHTKEQVDLSKAVILEFDNITQKIYRVSIEPIKPKATQPISEGPIKTGPVDRIDPAAEAEIADIFGDTDEVPAPKFVKEGETFDDPQTSFNEKVAIIKRIVPDWVSVQDIERLVGTLMSNGITMGAYLDHVIYLSEKSGNKTAYHESWHLIFRTAFDSNQIAELLNKAKMKYDKPTKSDLNKLSDLALANGKILTLSQLTDLYYEEKMADDFMEYAYSRDKETTGWFKRLINAIKKWINALMGKRNELEPIFSDVYEGKFKNMNKKSNDLFKNYPPAYMVIETKDVDGARIIESSFGILPKDTTNRIIYTMINNLIQNAATIPGFNPSSRERIEQQIEHQRSKYYNPTEWKEELRAYRDKNGRDAAMEKYNQIKIIGDALKNEENIRRIVADIQTHLKNVNIEALDTSHEEDLAEQEFEANSESDFARFDQALYEIGGLSSIGKAMKEYIFNTTEGIDEFGFGLSPSDLANERYQRTVNGNTIYTGLARLLTNTDHNKMFNKFYQFQKNNPASRSFFNKLVRDISDQSGVSDTAIMAMFSRDSLTNAELTALRESYIANSFLAAFRKDAADIYTLLFDKGTETKDSNVRVFAANRVGADKIQLEAWRGNFEALAPNSTDIATLMDQLFGWYVNDNTIADKADNQIDPMSLDAHAKRIGDGLKKIGIELSTDYIKWSLLDYHKEQWQGYYDNADLRDKYDEYNIFYNMFGKLTPLHNKADINKNTFVLIKKWSNEKPVEKERPSGFFSMLDNKEGIGTLKRIAKSNAVFDENVGESTYRNAEGKQANSIIPPTYITTMIRRIAESNLTIEDLSPLYDAMHITDQYRKEMLHQVLSHNNILKGLSYRKVGNALLTESDSEYADFILRSLDLIIADGMREESLDAESGQIEDWKQSEGGQTYKNLGAEAQELFKLSVYADSGSENDNVAFRDSEVNLRYFLVGNSEKSTQMFVKMPVHTGVVSGFGTPDARLTEYSRTAFYNLFAQEYERIQKIVREIEQIKNGTKTDFISTGYHGKKDLHHAMDIVDGKVRNANEIADLLLSGKHVARGLAFFRYGSHPLAKDMMIAALSGQPVRQNERAIKESMDAFYLPQITEYIDKVLVPFNAVGKETVSNQTVGTEDVSNVQIYKWSRYSDNGYEVSSQGDKRFSALVAKLKDGRTIEEAYQLDIKGYRSQGNNWRLGKGKAPLRNISKEQSWQEYKDLWRLYLQENPQLEQDLREKSKGKVLTDKFASTDVSQARALAELLNESNIVKNTVETPVVSSGVKYTNKLLPKKFGGKNQSLNMTEIANFFLNHTINTSAINQLLHGDMALNYKDLTDVTKRNGGMIAAGPSSSGTVRFKIESSVEKKIEDTELARHNVNHHDTIDRTNGQNFGNMRFYREHYLKPNGKHLNSVKPILNKIERGIDLVVPLTEDELDMLDQYNANLHDRKIVARDITLYDKTSLHTLTRAETSLINPTFRKDYEGNIDAQIEEMNRRYEVLDRARVSGNVSAIQKAASDVNEMYVARVGRLARHIRLNDMNYSNYDILLYDSAVKMANFDVDTDIVQEVDGEWFREQVNTDGFKKSIVHSTQLMQLIWSEQNPDAEVTWQGSKIKVGELVRVYNKLLAQRVKDKAIELTGTIFALTPDGKLTKEAYRELYAAIKNGLVTDDLWVTELFTLDPNDLPKFDANYPAVRYKYESMFLAFVSNRVFKTKTPGRKYTLVSDEGMEVAREIIKVIDTKAEALKLIKKGAQDIVEKDGRYYKVGNVVRDVRGKNTVTTRLRHAVKDKDRYGNEIYVSEAIVSEKAARMMGLKAGDTIPVDLAIQMGVRIPTQDKHSMVNIKIVDVIPSYYGNTIMLPYEIVALSGADFDIDSLFARMYATYQTSDKKHISYGSYLNSTNPERAAWREYITSKREFDITFETFLNIEIGDRIMKSIIADNVTAFNTGRLGGISPITNEELNNLLLDLELRLSYNDGNRIIAGSPAIMEYLKIIKKEFNSLGIQAKDTTTGVDTPLDQHKTAKALEIGNRGIGVSAVFNSMFQRLKAIGAVSGIKLFEDNYDTIDSFETLFNKTGVRKNDIFSAIISAMTDNAKERLATEFNLTLDTLGAAMYMMSVGVPVDSVLYMMRQPIISEYIKQMNAENSPIEDKARQKLGTLEVPRLKTTDKRALLLALQAFGKSDLDGVPFDNTDKTHMSNMIKAYESGGAMADIHPEHQQYVLDQFIKAKIVSEDLRSYRAVSSLLKGMDTSWYKVEALITQLQALGVTFRLKEGTKGLNPTDWTIEQNKTGGIPDNASGIDFVEMMKAYPVDYENAIAARAMIEGSKHYFLLQSNVAREIKSVVANQFQSYYWNYDENNKHLDDSLISFLISKAFRKKFKSGYKLANLVNEDTDNTLHDNIMLLKDKYPSNFFLQMVRVQPFTYTKGIYAGKRVHKVAIETNFSNDVVRQEEMIRGFYQLHAQVQKNQFENPGVVSLEEATMKKLIGYLVVKDGLLFKNGSFIRAISPYLIQDAFTGLTDIRTLFAGGTGVDYESVFGKKVTMAKLAREFTELYSRSSDTTYYLKQTPPFPNSTADGSVIQGEENGKYVINLYAGARTRDKDANAKQKEINSKIIKRMGIESINIGKSKQRSFPLFIKHGGQPYKLEYLTTYIKRGEDKKDKIELTTDRFGKVIGDKAWGKQFEGVYLPYLVTSGKLSQREADDILLYGAGRKATYIPTKKLGSKEISTFGSTLKEQNDLVGEGKEAPVTTKPSSLLAQAMNRLKEQGETTAPSGWKGLLDSLYTAKKGDTLTFDSAKGLVTHTFTQDMNAFAISSKPMWKTRSFTDQSGNPITDSSVSDEFFKLIEHIQADGKYIGMSYEEFMEQSQLKIESGNPLNFRDGGCK